MAILPVAMLAIVLLYLGQRLVRSGLAARGAELWLGGFFVATSFGLVGSFALALGMDLGVDPVAANLAAHSALQGGGCLFAAFVWRTFHPSDEWARRLFIGICFLLATNLLLFYWTGAYAAQSHPFHMVMSSSLVALFAWAFVESLLYYRVMRRRAALGLADASVTNRFLLFSAWTGACMLVPLVVTIVRAAVLLGGGGAQGAETLTIRPEAAWALQAIRLAIAVTGPVCFLGAWLCFFPPRGYTRWIEARAAR